MDVPWAVWGIVTVVVVVLAGILLDVTLWCVSTLWCLSGRFLSEWFRKLEPFYLISAERPGNPSREKYK